jgi:hypothetical protein
MVLYILAFGRIEWMRILLPMQNGKQVYNYTHHTSHTVQYLSSYGKNYGKATTDLWSLAYLFCTTILINLLFTTLSCNSDVSSLR